MAQLMDGDNQLRAWLTGADGVAAPPAATGRTDRADAVGGEVAGPVLDGDGLLRHAGRWVPIPDTQIPLADLLVRNVGTLVASSEIRATYVAAGGSGSATSLRSVVHRLGRRVAAVGLRLHVVRGRGVILDGADPTSG
jgi:hypothetical protein